jgi:antibiotic biosynthesis monooxygenase (ABM) superfamily enzyme
MYGTVARMRIKPGAEAKFLEVERSIEAAKIPGHVASYMYRMDGDPSEYYLAVVFTSKEAYHANANSPEQHERFQQLMSVLAAEPEWHDGEIMSSNA